MSPRRDPMWGPPPSGGWLVAGAALAACVAYSSAALSITPGAIASSCEIRGGAHRDVLVGTPHDDVICGRGGSDVIKGGAGKDKLLGGGGADRLVGGRKSDVIRGGKGPDALSGLRGADRLFGNPADDRLRGGAGRDTLDGGPGADHCVGGGGVDEFRGCQDLTAPVLEDVSVSPHAVDSSQGAAKVTVTVSAHDDISDYMEADVRFAPEGDGQTLHVTVDSDSQRMTESRTLTVPQYSAQGTYRLQTVDIRDRAGNVEWYSQDRLLAEGIHASFDQVGEGDTTPPTLTDFSFTPTEIDTSTSDQAIEFRLAASDDAAGIQQCGIDIRYPNGRTHGWGFCYGAADSREVTASQRISIPRYAPPGTYVVAVDLLDAVGNWHTYSESELAAAGFPTSFEQTAPGDTTPPALAGFTISPQLVHTDAGDADIRFDVHVTDDLAGFSDPLGPLDDVRFDVQGPERPGEHYPFGIRQYLGRTGSSTDSVYTLEGELSRYAAFGTYGITWVVVSDRVGNVSRFTGDDLSVAGFDSSFDNEPTP
jgi:hypothetical protein